MPQLPSGKHIAIQANRIDEMYDEAFNGTQAHKLMQIEDIEDLYPYVDVIYFEGDSDYVNAEDGAPGSIAMPDGLRPVNSGFTLATILQDIANWCEEDRKYFSDHLRSERVVGLLNSILGDVKQKQVMLLEEGPELGRLLAMYWRAGVHPLQEEQESPPNKWETSFVDDKRVQVFALAAMMRMFLNSKIFKEFTAQHQKYFDMLEGFISVAIGRNQDVLEPWLWKTKLASDEVAEEMWQAKVLDDLPQHYRGHLAGQMPYSINMFWPAMDNAEARELFPVEYEILSAAWLSPYVTKMTSGL